MEPPPHVQIGDRVRTLQHLHRLPAGSIGTVAQIFGTDGLLGVLFPGNRVPRFVYRDQLEVLRPQDVVNRRPDRAAHHATAVANDQPAPEHGEKGP